MTQQEIDPTVFAILLIVWTAIVFGLVIELTGQLVRFLKGRVGIDDD